MIGNFIALADSLVGFPITTWKGQKSNAGGVVCPEASL